MANTVFIDKITPIVSTWLNDANTATYGGTSGQVWTSDGAPNLGSWQTPPAGNVTLVELAASTGAGLVGYTQGGVGAATITAQAKLREQVSVKDFGAVGDGVVNDTAAIQAALDASQRVTFGSAANSYKVTASLNLQSGHLLDLQGATITMATDQKPMFVATGLDNVTIQGGRFVGKTEATFTNTPSSLAICITAANATDLRVTGNRFENFHYSPLMVGSGGNRIEFSGNAVKGPGASVLGVDVNRRNCTGATVLGSNIRISGNDIYDTATGIIIGQGSINIDIVGNIIHDLINEHGIYADTGLKNLTISGNVVRYTGIAGAGIKVQHYDSFGVMPENIVISGNSVSYTGVDGILIINTSGTSLYATGVSITGNTIYAAGQNGIDARYARGCTVSGNSVEQSAGCGLYLSKCAALNVVGNTIRITGSHGIFDDGTCADVTIANNIVNTPGGNPVNDCGILIQGVSEHVISGNVVRGSPSKTLYSFYISAASTLTTTEVRGNSFTGSNGVAARFPTGAGQLRYFGENLLQGVAGVNVGQSIPEALQRGTEEHIYFGTAVPSSGTWPQGAKVVQRYPAAGGFSGWVCVVGGTPGTWKTYGAVTA